VGTATAQQNGGNQQRNSYGAYGILTEFVSTATERWKLGMTESDTSVISVYMYS